MLKNFYLFRHGETEMNAVKVFQGSLLNGPLTERGRQQAEELREAIKNDNILEYRKNFLEQYNKENI